MLSKYFGVFLFLVLLAEILGTVGGFGSSVFFVPVANYFFKFQTVLGLTALFHLASNVVKIAFFKKGIDKRVIIYLGIPAVLFVIIGAYLSQFFNTNLLSYFLGGFLIVLSIVFLIFKDLVIKASNKNAIIGGILSGFSAGLLGTGGAIRGITLSAFKMNKEKFIATSAIIDLGVDLSRSVVYYKNGYIQKDILYIIPILLVISVIGTYIGKKILNKISQDQFRNFVLILILIIGISSFVSLWF
ncbi:sulfite exporter TauE/SafE family protein [Mesoflavibacter profundi]|uniref:Probable membrane transporter protein n=1 Tax=Mesoflavibacter profundi TaxID=2708110 RepID=A0ABT4RWZ8_9FLAO|nr:sulfite exporter TauE/SafE family protein [Mesoflavibacter profundi]MDA0176341.1 sulfite exporter TauE/SafE family protein [Mesoflavibacter profundi]